MQGYVWSSWILENGMPVSRNVNCLLNCAGLAGLAVTYALALGSSLAVFSIWRCFLSIYILSVERIKQYLDLPREAPAVIESNRPPPEWPSNGEVCLDHLEVGVGYLYAQINLPKVSS